MSAKLLKAADGVLDFTAVAAKTAADAFALPDGRVGVFPNSIEALKLGSIQTAGIFNFTKTANIYMLEGQGAWITWSTGAISYTGDAYVGVVAETAAGSATLVQVEINVPVTGIRAQGAGDWMRSTTGAATITNHANKTETALTTATEAQRAVYYLNKTITIAELPVIEFWHKCVTATDNAAANFNVGLSTENHATAFASGAKFAALHMKGNDLSLWFQSADGTNTNATADTTVDVVAGTEVFVQIDLSGALPVVYVNGLVKTPAATTAAFAPSTTALYPIIDLGKTSDDGPGVFSVRELMVRSMRKAA